MPADVRSLERIVPGQKSIARFAEKRKVRLPSPRACYTYGILRGRCADDGLDPLSAAEEESWDDPDVVAYGSVIDRGGASADEAAVYVVDEEPGEES